MERYDIVIVIILLVSGVGNLVTIWDKITGKHASRVDDIEKSVYTLTSNLNTAVAEFSIMLKHTGINLESQNKSIESLKETGDDHEKRIIVLESSNKAWFPNMKEDNNVH